MKDNYSLLIEKLDVFIRKYYVNQLIRGALYSLGLILALFLGLNFLNHYVDLTASTRKGLFFSFVGVSAVALSVWIAMPLLHYFRLGEVISHEKAAQIIGDHFAAVKDKLLNILQLRRQSENADNRDLILASINQKSEEIRPVPFKAAINLYHNKKYLRYALPPLALLIFLLFAAPSIIRDGSARLFNYNKEYERAAPFHFSLDPAALKVVQFQDYDLRVGVEGTVTPKDVFINLNGYQYKLNKENDSTFTYKFSSVSKDVPFNLFSGPIASPAYTLAVLKKPNMAGFDIKLDYPEYTGRKNETLANTGDLMVPAGTNITWIFNAVNTDDVQAQFNGKKVSANRQGENRFVYSRKAMTDETYKVFISNKILPHADSVSYSLTVQPDLYPTINAEKFEDSVTHKRLFFVGDASDDYGLKNLSFYYQVKPAEGAQGALVKIPLTNPMGKQAQFQHAFNLEDLHLKPGDEVSYYFEVYDNDAVNGPKAAKTNRMTFAVPSVDQMEKQSAKNNDDIKQELKKALSENKKIGDDLKKLREKMLQQKDIDFSIKKEAENLVKRQSELEKEMQQAKQQFDENVKNEKEFTQKDEEMQKKQDNIQKMFEELQNPEMKELMKQIEDLLQKMNKEQALDKMQDMKLNQEQLDKELDRMQELFKQLELEDKMQRQVEKLEELAKKEEELSKKSEDGSKNQEDLKKEQEDVKKEFDKVKEDSKDIDKKNQELEHPEKVPDTKEEQKDVQKDLNDAKENLDQKQNNKASKSQKSAAGKMKNMANKMKSSMQQAQQDQNEEDMKTIRQLLENLVTLSFDQEALMNSFGTAAENTPRYITLTQQQHKINDNFTTVEDSLQALAKRQAKIATFVTQKVTDVKQQMQESVRDLEDRRKESGVAHEQRSMTYLNDLALMLSETMSQMQQQMASSMPGSQVCKKPGNNPNGKGGKKPGDKMSQGQQNLNQQLKDLKARMQKQGQGGAGSKEFAQMAAQQAALRNALKQKQKEAQARGQGADKNVQEAIDKMDKTETELVNKKLSEETMKRQEDIMTRLLENEKAERERGEDEQRKAETAKARQNAPPPALQEYIKKRQAEIEQYNTASPALKPYYKQLVEDYFKSLKGK